MSIAVPSICWPGEFVSGGPPQDPTILLTAQVRIGEVAFVLSAVRMHAQSREPDYRPDVPRHAYESMIDSMVDDIEDLAESTSLHHVAIDGSQYLLWIIPAAGD
jgi:hypothetical protein